MKKVSDASEGMTTGRAAVGVDCRAPVRCVTGTACTPLVWRFLLLRQVAPFVTASRFLENRRDGKTANLGGLLEN